MEEDKNPENKFEVELMKRMDRVIVNIKDFNTRFDSLENRFDSLENKFDSLEQNVSQIKTDVGEVKADVKILKAQFSDVAVMAIEDNKRIAKLEKDVEDLQSSIH